MMYYQQQQQQPSAYPVDYYGSGSYPNPQQQASSGPTAYPGALQQQHQGYPQHQQQQPQRVKIHNPYLTRSNSEVSSNDPSTPTAVLSPGPVYQPNNNSNMMMGGGAPAGTRHIYIPSAHHQQQQQQHQMQMMMMASQQQQQQQMEFGFAQQGSSGAAAAAAGGGQQPYAPIITTEELMQHSGTFVELARSAAGSSFIQSALRPGLDWTVPNAAILAEELLPAASDLLLDAHGCYVIKSLMERIPVQQLHGFAVSIAMDEQLIFSMCTHSLHTRRVVQFLIDMIGVELMGNVLITRCVEISMTQQGCIIMQRAMDVAAEPLRTHLFTTIFAHLLRFAFDPFANYVVQHMLEVGDREASSRAVKAAFCGHVIRLSCNKFASNVMEKCLFHLTEDAQHELLLEMYDITDDELHGMLQDSFGNYMIQSSIALANQKDVAFINDKLKNVLQRTPYGHKIESRLERRLKGRPVGTRSPQIGANSKTSRFARGGAGGGNGGGRGGGANGAGGPHDLVEEPW